MIIAVVFICCGEAGLRDFAREFQKYVESYEDDGADEFARMGGLATVGEGPYHGEGGPQTRLRTMMLMCSCMLVLRV